MVNPGEPITVRPYGNRRLYQPGAARHATSSALQQRMRDGIVVVMRDAASGADITDPVLSPSRASQRRLSQSHLSPRRTEH